MISQQVSFNTNNNDPVESPASCADGTPTSTSPSPSPSKVVKLPLLPLTRRLSEIGMISQQGSFNTNNNDPVESPASCADGTQTSTSPSQSKVVKMLLLPLTRRLPKFGKRSSPVRDKDSPSTSTMAVDDPHVQTQQNDDQKTKDLEDRKDTYQEGNYCGRNKKNQRYHLTNVNYRQSNMLLIFSQSVVGD